MKLSKEYNVRVFRDLATDIIQEFDTLEEAEKYCKTWKNNFCLISKSIEEFDKGEKLK